MFTATLFSKPAAVPHSARRQTYPCSRLKHSWIIIAAAVLQTGCSMLIRFDDGIDDETNPSLGGSLPDPMTPDAGPPGAGSGGTEGIGGSGAGGSSIGGSGIGGSGPGDAGVSIDAGPIAPPAIVFDLAFIEAPEESDATLRLVSTERALSAGPSAGEPPWRLTLRPASQAGDALDFAWSPDGERIAVRYVHEQGVRLAIFAAPEWRELAREEDASPGTLPDLDATANYRWSPSSDALAVELSGAELPLVGAYVIEGETAFGVVPTPFAGPIETMHWRTATSLYVIQPQDGVPELLDLRLNEREFETPESLFSVLFSPLELRRVSGGLVAASDDATNSLNFWPDPADQGSETSFTPSAYLSGGASFAAEIVGTSAEISPIDSVFTVVDSVPDCPTVLTWIDGPEPRSIAGAKLACLSVRDEVPAISVHSYDADRIRTSTALDHDVLRADFVSTDTWEAHSRSFSPRGEFLALATSTHDVLIDLRGASPLIEVRDVTAQGNTARGFSPSGELLVEQRGSSVEVALLAAPGGVVLRPALPAAFAAAPACVIAHHSDSWCGGPGPARQASVRWSLGRDVAAFLAAGEGLTVLSPTSAVFGLEREFVSTCGAGCVTQYEFGR